VSNLRGKEKKDEFISSRGKRASAPPVHPFLTLMRVALPPPPLRPRQLKENACILQLKIIMLSTHTLYRTMFDVILCIHTVLLQACSTIQCNIGVADREALAPLPPA